jgi:hypothetical protein
MKLVGQMALCRFPLWERCLESLADKVDELYLRFDGRNGDPEIYNSLDDVCGDKLKEVFVSESRWNAWNWREEMIRMLDDVRPDMVLSHDEDEEVELSIFDDIKKFEKSDYKQMALAYKLPMPTEKNYDLGLNKPFPSKPHVMVIKWKPGLTFNPYMSRNRITQYGKKYMLGKAKILHYCYYTLELRELKLQTASHKGKLEWASQAK